MSKSFSEKTSGLFVTLFIGFIVISFVVSGYQGGQGSKDTIGKVGDYNITISEYQNVYQRQLAFYRQIYGGKDLTSQQIKQLKLRENITQQLINQKLMLIFGDEIGNFVSSSEVKDSIKNYAQNGEKIFMSDGQFNVTLYKQALQRAGIPISKFEEDNRTMLQNKKAFDLVASYPLSNNFINDVKEFRKNAIKAQIIQLNSKSLEKFIVVKGNELKDYLAKQENVDLTKARYEAKKNVFARPAEVKARHILITPKPGKEKDAEKEIKKIAKKVNKKNFVKMANKYGDGSKNKNGGDLGWFSRGKMVPEFEAVVFGQKPGTISKPVKTPFGWHIIYIEKNRAEVVPTFADFKNEVATQIIQEGKQEELLKLAKGLEGKLVGLMNAGKVSAIEKLQKKYNFQFIKELSINQFDGTAGKVKISGPNLNKLFQDKTGRALLLREGNVMSIAKARKTKATSSKDEEDMVVERLKQTMGQVFTVDLSNQMRAETEIKIFKFY